MFVQLVALSVSLSPVLAAAPTPQARSAFERGEKALASGQLQEAETQYKAAIATTPGYAEAINGLGSVYFKQGKREEAIAQFKQANAADPKFPLAYFNLGYAARKVGDFATAAQAYETYTTLKPEDPDGFYGLGESYRNLGENAKAISAYEQYTKREKRPTEQKWVAKAKETIAELKTLPPEPVKTAQAPQTGPAQPQDNPAQPAAPSASNDAPPSPALAKDKLAEGDRFMKQKDYRSASFAYQDAVNADPDNIEALFKLGNAYAVLGYYPQAIERWNKVASLATDARVKQSAQDNIQKAQAKMAQAGGSTPQAAGQAPGTGPVAPATRQQARAAYEEGVKAINNRDFQGALRSLTEAIQLEPTLAVAYVARGSAYIGLRRYSEAAADYQYANQLEPGMSSPLYGMAEAYRALGRNADARNYYEKYAASTASDVRPELQAQARNKAAQLR